MKKIFLLTALLSSFHFFAQISVSNPTITTPNFVINRYAPVAQNVVAGSSVVVVNNAPSFSFGICPGDLIMVYQAQGAQIDTNNTSAYGNSLYYNSAGLYVFKYVQSVFGNTIQT